MCVGQLSTCAGPALLSPGLPCVQNLPFYRLFVADSRFPRDGRHLEQVGHYDPIPGGCSGGAGVAGWACKCGCVGVHSAGPAGGAAACNLQAAAPAGQPGRERGSQQQLRQAPVVASFGCCQTNPPPHTAGKDGNKHLGLNVERIRYASVIC